MSDGRCSPQLGPRNKWIPETWRCRACGETFNPLHGYPGRCTAVVHTDPPGVTLSDGGFAELKADWLVPPIREVLCGSTDTEKLQDGRAANSTEYTDWFYSEGPGARR